MAAAAKLSVMVTRLDNPLLQLVADHQRASAVNDPCANRCYLATVTPDGAPALRTLVLQSVESGKLEIYFSATSPKWRDLQSNPEYELLVYWPSIARQYRINGGFEQIPQAEMAEHWKQKSGVGKQLDIYYSNYQPQSSTLPDQGDFDSVMNEIREKLDRGECALAPASIRGLRLLPWRVEILDLSDEDRLHRRCVYTYDGDAWRVKRLVP